MHNGNSLQGRTVLITFLDFHPTESDGESQPCRLKSLRLSTVPAAVFLFLGAARARFGRKLLLGVMNRHARGVVRDQSRRSGVSAAGTEAQMGCGAAKRATRQAAAKSFARKRTKESIDLKICLRSPL